jgi:transcriptional regulator GlxA family with amidase domain
VGEGGACLLDLSKPFEQGNDQRHPAELWWIRFDGPEMSRMAARLGVDLNPAFDHLPRRRFQSLFRQLWTLIVRKPVGHEAQCHAILTAILSELFMARSRQADIARQLGSEAKLSERMHAAIDYMSARTAMPIGLKEIAAAVNLNLYHFARRFRREVGVSPMQYFNRCRIEQSKQLLTSTEKPIAEVGRLVGIADPGYFARLFRKQTGESPQAWRARNVRGR